MKVNNISNNNIKNQSFNGIGAKIVDKMVNIQNAVVGAGVATTFVCQDFLGSEAPRIITGLFRNSDKTGELNYKFASMEACRELLTAPVMMFLPIATFALADKYIGGTTRTPITAIESFTDKMTTAYKSGASAVNDSAQLKQAFYKTSWTDALKNTCGGTYEPSKDTIEKLSSLMTELETSRNRTLKDRIKKVPEFRTSKDIIGDISNIVSNEIRSNAPVQNSFTKIIYKDALGKESSSTIGSFIGHMKGFAKDSLDFIGDTKNLSADDFVNKITTFMKKRSGARVLMNFATMAAAILYVTQVPKIYKSLNKTNPGLIGLEEAKDENTVVKSAPIDYEAFEKLKKANAQNGQNNPAFRGLGLGKIADGLAADGKFRKIAKAFEFDGINMGFATLLSVMGLGVIYPRVKNAYDKHDKREILTRDILTISALVAGAKALYKTISRVFEKTTGFAMSEKNPDYFKMSKPRRIFEHLRPFGGVQVYSDDEIVLKYSNIDKYKGGFKGFCESISKAGGNLVKFFANDKDTKSNMEQMLGKALKDSSEEEIMTAIADKKNAKFIENIINVFKDKNNVFIKKAKSITGVFGFMSTFVAVPAFMIFLQKFNEKVTKHAIAKEQEEKKAFEQKFTAIKLTADLNAPDKSTLNLK